MRFASHLCVAVAFFDHRNEVKVVAEAQAYRREATAGHEACALPTAAFFDRRNEVKVVAKVGFAASGFLPFCLSPSGYNLTEEFNA